LLRRQILPAALAPCAGPWGRSRCGTAGTEQVTGSQYHLLFGLRQWLEADLGVQALIMVSRVAGDDGVQRDDPIPQGLGIADLYLIFVAVATGLNLSAWF
jgi:hypothetical protein